MNRSFYNHSLRGLRRMLCVILSVLVMTAVLSGCSTKTEETQPSTGNMLDLGNETTPSADASTTEAASDPTAETVNAEILNIRSTPGLDGTVIGHLQPGATIDVLREEPADGLRWALIREGWICIEYLEQYIGADGVFLGINGETVATTAPDETAAETTAATKPAETTAPTTGGNTGDTGITTGTGTATNTLGVVIASELNIRKDADISSDSVGQYKYGDRITIVETKNGWGRTDKGWVYMDYVYKDGTTGKNSCKGVVTTNGLNIRSGPGTKYDAVGSLNTGSRVSVLERIQIGDSWWGCIDKGWISMDYVYVDGTEGDGAGYGTVSADGVNVRSGPGTGFDVVGSLNSGDNLDILFQIEIGDTAWGCIGVGKWVCMSYVGMG